MKSWRSTFVIFFLLLALKGMEATRSPEEYWKEVMGKEPLPEAIQDLLMESRDPVHRGVKGSDASAVQEDWDRLINRDFDTRSVAIIYHHHNDDDHHHHDGHLVPDGPS